MLDLHHAVWWLRSDASLVGMYVPVMTRTPMLSVVDKTHTRRIR